MLRIAATTAVALALALALVGSLAPAPPAGAATARTVTSATAARPGTALRLSLTYPAASTSGTRMVTLTCDPPGGTHPRAAAACADLRRHGGNPVHKPADQVCVMIYAPVVATAEGRWNGAAVRFRGEFPNDCVLHAHTGAVFRF